MCDSKPSFIDFTQQLELSNSTIQCMDVEERTSVSLHY